MKETQKINEKTADNPTEKLLKEIEVLEVIEMKKLEPKKKKGGVTSKTLGAMREQIERISTNNLISVEDYTQLQEIMGRVRNTWIERTL